jgi:hypothetical protein
VEGVQTVVGIGVIDLTAGTEAAPELVLIDPAAGTGLQELLSDALRGRAAALARNRVA